VSFGAGQQRQDDRVCPPTRCSSTSKNAVAVDAKAQARSQAAIALSEHVLMSILIAARTASRRSTGRI
jgi:hypothetical protein